MNSDNLNLRKWLADGKSSIEHFESDNYNSILRKASTAKNKTSKDVVDEVSNFTFKSVNLHPQFKWRNQWASASATVLVLSCNVFLKSSIMLFLQQLGNYFYWIFVPLAIYFFLLPCVRLQQGFGQLFQGSFGKIFMQIEKKLWILYSIALFVSIIELPQMINYVKFSVSYFFSSMTSSEFILTNDKLITCGVQPDFNSCSSIGYCLWKNDYCVLSTSLFLQKHFLERTFIITNSAKDIILASIIGIGLILSFCVSVCFRRNRAREKLIFFGMFSQFIADCGVALSYFSNSRIRSAVSAGLKTPVMNQMDIAKSTVLLISTMVVQLLTFDNSHTYIGSRRNIQARWATNKLVIVTTYLTFTIFAETILLACLKSAFAILESTDKAGVTDFGYSVEPYYLSELVMVLVPYAPIMCASEVFNHHYRPTFWACLYFFANAAQFYSCILLKFDALSTMLLEVFCVDFKTDKKHKLMTLAIIGVAIIYIVSDVLLSKTVKLPFGVYQLHFLTLEYEKMLLMLRTFMFPFIFSSVLVILFVYQLSLRTNRRTLKVLSFLCSIVAGVLFYIPSSTQTKPLLSIFGFDLPKGYKSGLLSTLSGVFIIAAITIFVYIHYLDSQEYLPWSLTEYHNDMLRSLFNNMLYRLDENSRASFVEFTLNINVLIPFLASVSTTCVIIELYRFSQGQSFVENDFYAYDIPTLYKPYLGLIAIEITVYLLAFTYSLLAHIFVKCDYPSVSLTFSKGFSARVMKILTKYRTPPNHYYFQLLDQDDVEKSQIYRHLFSSYSMNESARNTFSDVGLTSFNDQKIEVIKPKQCKSIQYTMPYSLHILYVVSEALGTNEIIKNSIPPFEEFILPDKIYNRITKRKLTIQYY